VLAVSKSTRARHNRGGSSSSSSTAVTTSSSSSIIIKSPAAVETKQAWKVSIPPPVLDSTADDTDADTAAVPGDKVLKQENGEPSKGAAKRRKKVKADVQVEAVEGVTPSAETTAAAAVKPRRNLSRAVKG
jgi:hypothetical protein